jgi:DHA1 family tetracycline resistance protein-like MFS transporter
MCAPDDETETLKRETGQVTQSPLSVLKRGTLLGAVSLGLLLVASSLTKPHLQNRHDELGCDSLCMGSLTSARSTLKLVGAAIMGRLSDSRALDNYGGARRFCLVTGIAAAAIGLVVANRAGSIGDLWVSLLPSALQQNLSISKALFSEYHESIPGGSSAGERASSAGILGMAAGLAMMVGPLVGATLLCTYDQATVAALISLILAASLVLLMPNARAKRKKSKENKKTESPRFLRSLDIPSARSPAAIFMLTCQLLSTTSFHIYHTIWTVSLRDRFQFGPQDYGRFYSMKGLFQALSQGFLSKFLLNRVGGERYGGRVHLLATCIFVVGFARYLSVQTSNLAVFYVLHAVLSTALGVISTVFTADCTQIAAPEELGSFFGLIAAVESGAGIGGPLVGGALSYVHPTAAPMAVVSLSGIVFCMVVFGYERIVSQNLQKNSKAMKRD